MEYVAPKRRKPSVRPHDVTTQQTETDIISDLKVHTSGACSGLATSAPLYHYNWRNKKEMFYYVTQQRYNNKLLLLLKHLGIVVRLFGGFNYTAFPHDLTSRPGLSTGTHVVMHVHHGMSIAQIINMR
jgi:hypothetical protein